MMPLVKVRPGAWKFGHPKAVLKGEGGQPAVTLPFAPVEATLNGLARTWTGVPRPSRTTVLTDTGPGLPTLTFTVIVARSDGVNIQTELAGLADLAGLNTRVAVDGLSDLEAGWWRITGCEIRILRREYGTNFPTIAEVGLEFTRAATSRVSIARSKKPKK